MLSGYLWIVVLGCLLCCVQAFILGALAAMNASGALTQAKSLQALPDFWQSQLQAFAQC